MFKLALKTALCGTIALMTASFTQTTWACTTNDPHYHSCVYHNIILPHEQQMREAQAQAQILYEPIDFTPAPILLDQGKFAVALSPSTGAVGASSFAWKDSATHHRLMVGHDTFALASCISKTRGEPISSFTLKNADKFVKKYGKKSDCQVVKESSPANESLVAVLKGQLPNGKYQLFMATRPSNSYLFSQQQPEFKSLLATCQAQATNCEIVGQFGDTTELY